MARAASKAGGLARQAAQKLSPSKATAKGKPQQLQPGPSRKLMPLQQAAQKPGWPTAALQRMQSGGKSTSRAALATFPSIDASLARMPDDRPPLFDFSASLRARERAKRLAGNRFLDRAAAEG